MKLVPLDAGLGMSGLVKSHGKCGLSDSQFTTENTDNNDDVIAALNSVAKGSTH